MSEPRVRYQHTPWAALATDAPAAGIHRQMVVGDQLMICRLRFDPFVVTAVHTHPHEQMTIVERGKVRFFIEHEERIAKAGDVLHFPSNVEHGATMLEEEVVLFDIFTPLREDFLQARRG
jgi:quercetin dioxygenase-like cupin family protein